MITPEAKDPQQSAIESRRGHVMLLCEEATTGKPENRVTNYSMESNSLELLTPYFGKQVEILVSCEDWIYTGVESNEEHSTWTHHIEGRLVRADKHNIEILAEKGETGYDIEDSRPITPGPMQFPYMNHEINLGRPAKIVQIEQIRTADSIFLPRV